MDKNKLTKLYKAHIIEYEQDQERCINDEDDIYEYIQGRIDTLKKVIKDLEAISEHEAKIDELIKVYDKLAQQDEYKASEQALLYAFRDELIKSGG